MAPRARLHHVVLDCPDPRQLAEFYSSLLDQPVTYDDGDWAVVTTDETSSGLAFQRADNHRRPTWPEPDIPPQLHLDIMVNDPESATARAVALGAVRATDGNVLIDPAGHPFCLIIRPRWSDPLDPD